MRVHVDAGLAADLERARVHHVRGRRALRAAAALDDAGGDAEPAQQQRRSSRPPVRRRRSRTGTSIRSIGYRSAVMQGAACKATQSNHVEGHGTPGGIGLRLAASLYHRAAFSGILSLHQRSPGYAPPSSCRFCPVMKPARPLHRKAQASPTSSGRPSRRRGCGRGSGRRLPRPRCR